jgi:type IV pilus assembly protein PilA
MKKRNGFTLIELLAVIVVLGIIIVIAIPNIIRIINQTKVNAYNSQMELIKDAASKYLIQYSGEVSNLDNVSVSLNTLISKNLIANNLKNPITHTSYENIIVTIKRTGTTTTYGTIDVPDLVIGMIPVYYDETIGTWKKANSTNLNNSWYDYSKQQWANAVTVTSTNRATYQSAAVGTTIPMSDINTMFVWIPRYKYLIPAGTGAREVDVVFESKYTSKSNGDSINTYYTHPAFTFGTDELSGIWVGKFETTGTITDITIKPDLQSVRSQTVKAMYEAVKNTMQSSATYGFTNDSDTRMMKNTEWGAVTYLSQSAYGKYGNTSYVGNNKELYLNNSSSYYTGRSMGTYGGNGIKTPTNEYIADGYYTYDGKCATINASLPAPCNSGSTGQALTDKTLAYGATTTGNIYGIYDISGGSWEYVMGMYKPNLVPATGISDLSGYSSTTTDSQYDLLIIDNKYYNQYLTNSASTGAIVGDATKEVSGWYGDYAYFVSPGDPWFVRGGCYDDSAGAGAFGSRIYSGGPYGFNSFRIVLNPIN